MTPRWPPNLCPPPCERECCKPRAGACMRLGERVRLGRRTSPAQSRPLLPHFPPPCCLCMVQGCLLSPVAPGAPHTCRTAAACFHTGCDPSAPTHLWAPPASSRAPPAPPPARTFSRAPPAHRPPAPLQPCSFHPRVDQLHLPGPGLPHARHVLRAREHQVKVVRPLRSAGGMGGRARGGAVSALQPGHTLHRSCSLQPGQALF